MKAIDPEGFEAMFRRDADPWNYERSRFEAVKRRDLLAACGTRTYGRGLELGCANGRTSRELAARCLRLVALDASPTVIEAARAGVRDPRVEFRVGRLPEGFPEGAFDLVVMSELIYYLSRPEMDALLRLAEARLHPGGRIVLLNHMVRFDDAAQWGERAHARAVARLGRRLRTSVDRRRARYRVTALDRAV